MDEAHVLRSLTIAVEDVWTKELQMQEIWDTERWVRELEYAVEVRTKYKKKGQKVNPVNIPLSHGIKPGGGTSKNSGIHAGKSVSRGSRLTLARLAAMKIGTGILFDTEIGVFIDILFKYEGALSWEDSEMGMLDPAIEPPMEIHAVPHEPWQQQNLRLPRAMRDAHSIA
jgi:hypothetical protein